MWVDGWAWLVTLLWCKPVSMICIALVWVGKMCCCGILVTACVHVCACVHACACTCTYMYVCVCVVDGVYTRHSCWFPFVCWLLAPFELPPRHLPATTGG